MNKIFETYRPDGFGTVNSYLFSAEPERLIDFLKQAFFAKEINRSLHSENGTISNCILKIGDSCLMISQGRGPFVGMKTSFYLFVEQVDDIYERAINHGALSIFEPADMDYGDRQAGVTDPSGNHWWLSKRLEEKGYAE